MDKDIIEKINERCPYDQGIFIEPFGCDGIKEPLIYKRWLTGGEDGGNCWDGEDNLYSFAGDPEPNFDCLDLVLEELKPNITFLDYKQIEKMIVSDWKSDIQYYGNHDDYNFKYIKLSNLETFLNELNY